MIDSQEIPELDRTINARAAGWELPIPGTHARRPILTPGEVFLEAVLKLTEKAVDGDLPQIRRAGDAAAFAQAYRQAR